MIRYLIAGVLVVVLAVDLGYQAWNARPWVVTGWAVEVPSNINGVRYRIAYTLPGGGTGYVDRFNNDCTGSLGIGYSLPRACR